MNHPRTNPVGGADDSQRAGGLPKVLALRWALCSLAVMGVLALVACSPRGENKSAALAAINKGLSSGTDCLEASVGVEYSPTAYGASPERVLRTLLAQGLAKEGPVTVAQLFGPPKTKPGFVFAEEARPMIVPRPSNGLPNQLPCVRNGHFEVTQVDAIDVANDATGHLFASVRAHIHFVPEEWLAKTRDDPAWSIYWAGMKRIEEPPYLYQLLKSGEEFYFTQRGTALK